MSMAYFATLPRIKRLCMHVQYMNQKIVPELPALTCGILYRMIVVDEKFRSVGQIPNFSVQRKFVVSLSI